MPRTKSKRPNRLQFEPEIIELLSDDSIESTPKRHRVTNENFLSVEQDTEEIILEPNKWICRKISDKLDLKSKNNIFIFPIHSIQDIKENTTFQNFLFLAEISKLGDLIVKDYDSIIISSKGDFGLCNRDALMNDRAYFGVVYSMQFIKILFSCKKDFLFSLHHNDQDQEVSLLLYIHIFNSYPLEIMGWAYGTEKCLNLKLPNNTCLNSIYNTDRLCETNTQYDLAKIFDVNYSLERLLDSLSENSISNTSIYNDEYLDQISGKLLGHGISTSLRNYQLRGIIWLILRENKDFFQSNTEQDKSDDGLYQHENDDEDDEDIDHPPLVKFLLALKNSTVDGWATFQISQIFSSCFSQLEPIKSTEPLNSYDVWYNIFSGRFSLNKPLSIELVTGGILADMMGIGKTVQILSLISVNSPSTHEIPIPAIEEDRDSGTSRSAGTRYLQKFKVDMQIDETTGYGDDDDNLFDGRRSEGDTDIVNIENACFCGVVNMYPSFHLGWIRCTECSKRRHASCCGFDTTEEMKSVRDFICFACVTSELLYLPDSRKPKGKTLLIVPETLLSQWIDQFNLHTDSRLSLFIYPGVKDLNKCAVSSGKKNLKSKPTDNCFPQINPYALIEKDIVITTFEIFQEELNRTISPYNNNRTSRGIYNFNRNRRFFDPVRTDSSASARSMRNPKKYDVFPSPLACINWHRIVIDEAQEVEKGNSNLINMTMKLSGVHKWCVSGTPLGHGKLEDLKNIMAFLGQYPYHSVEQWKLLCSGRDDTIGQTIVYSHLTKLLKALTLRRSHEAVEAELGLQLQSVKTKFLEFSDIEKHNYKKKEETIINEIYGGDYADHSAINIKLLQLRKLCCHPQMADKRLGNNESVLSMTEICFKMIEDSRRNCEEKQRSLVFSNNGLVGIVKIIASLAKKMDSDYNGLSYQDWLDKCWDCLIKVITSYEKNRSLCPIISSVILIGNFYSELDTVRLSSRSDNLIVSWTRNQHFHPHLIHESVNHGELVDVIDLKKIDAFETYEEDTQSESVDLKDIFNEKLSSIIDFSSGKNSSTFKEEIKKKSLSRGTHAGSTLGRRIKKLRVSFDFDELIKNSSIIDFENIEFPILHIFFPASVSLQICIPGTSSYSKIKEFTIPCPIITFDNNEFTLRKINRVVTNIVSSYRSKSWKICIEKFHTVGLKMYHNFIDQKKVVKLELLDLKNYSSSSLLTLDSNVKYIVPIQLSLFDSSFEIDLFQEVHTKEKICEVAREMVSSEHKIDKVTKDMQELHQIIAQNSEEHRQVDLLSLQEILALLESQVSDLKAKEVQTALQRQLLAFQKFHESETQIYNLLQNNDDSSIYYGDSLRNDWWVPVIKFLTTSTDTNHGLDKELISDLIKVVIANDFAYRSTFYDIREASGIQYVLHTLTSELFDKRELVSSKLKKLPNTPSQEDVKETGNCKRCCKEFGRTGAVCKHCQLDEKLSDYISTLYSYRKRALYIGNISSSSSSSSSRQDNDFEESTAAPHTSEQHRVDGPVLMLNRLILSFVDRNKYVLAKYLDLNVIIESGKKLIKFLELFQKESVILNSIWKRHLELLFVYDEVNMVMSSLSLVTPEEYIATPESSRGSVVLEDEVLSKFMSYESECSLAESGLRNAISELSYRKHLELSKRQATAGGGEGEGSSAELCGICLDPLITDITILPCGQTYHMDCISIWLSSHHKCPVCKKPAKLNQLRLIEKNTIDSIEVRKFLIQGEWGTKVDTVISDILELTQKGVEKCIVFTQWKEMFHILTTGFRNNQIKFEICLNKTDFSSSGPLGRFKIDPSIKVLILLLSHGSNGLTITEASHVFLLEPILNVQLEAQAVNRVHRIGQTRPTFVHKYIINNTIEKKIHNMNEAIFEKEGGIQKVISKIASSSAFNKAEQETLSLEQFQYLFDKNQD